MNSLFFKYYYDLTRINILVSIIIGLQYIVICFGTFGMLISFIIYRYYKNDQYYFYLNHGFTKKELIKDILTKYKNNKGIIITDHYYRDIFEIAHKKIIIKDRISHEIFNLDKLCNYGYVPLKTKTHDKN